MNEAIVESVVYQYKWRFIPFAWLLVLTPFVVYLGVVSIITQGWLDGVSFLVIALSFVLPVGLVLIIGLADVVIDSNGVSRVFFGAISQRMAWVDVARIHISNSKSPEDGQLVRSFLFVSAKGVGNFFSRRITFQERKQGMSALLDKMRSCAQQHRVRIVDVSAIDEKQGET
jgi:hypothetical protein